MMMKEQQQRWYQSNIYLCHKLIEIPQHRSCVFTLLVSNKFPAHWKLMECFAVIHKIGCWVSNGVQWHWRWKKKKYSTLLGDKHLGIALDFWSEKKINEIFKVFWEQVIFGDFISWIFDEIAFNIQLNPKSYPKEFYFLVYFYNSLKIDKLLSTVVNLDRLFQPNFL